MRYAVMSDVHANPRALEAALADAKRFHCGRYVMLGDITGYGYDPARALELVRANFDVVLMGNHDSACAGLEPEWETVVNHNYAQDLAARAALSRAGMSWLKSRPLVAREGDCAFAHGDFSAPGEWRYVFEDPEAAACFAADASASVMFCGHTHHAAVWQLSERGELRRRFERAFERPPDKPEASSFKIAKGCRLVVNVGSVGYPRNDLCLTYAVYDDVTRRLVIRRLPFDYKTYIADMITAGVQLPVWLVSFLRNQP